MNKFVRLLAVAGFILTTIVPIAAQQPTKPATPPEEKTDEKAAVLKLERETPFDGDVDFPEVEGWLLSPKIVYPQAALGYSVNYESEKLGARVTVYVYNGGRSSIPNSLTGAVAEELERARAEIMAVVEAGFYERATPRASETITLGGGDGNVKALYAYYEIAARGRTLDSEIYLFPYNNHFVKFRATLPKGGNVEEKAAAFSALLDAMDELFSK